MEEKEKVVKVGWGLLDEFKRNLAAWHKKEHFDCVVGILRGGGIPAICASNILKLPVYWIEVSSYKGQKQGELTLSNLTVKDSFSKDCTVLLVDDILDSGATMNKVVPWLLASVGAVRPVTLITKKPAKDNELWKFQAVRSMPKNAWIVFPWEE